MRINEEGYLEKRAGRDTHVEHGYRDWFPVRATNRKGGLVTLGNPQVTLPAELIGKKVRFKIEILPEKKGKDTLLWDTQNKKWIYEQVD